MDNFFPGIKVRSNPSLLLFPGLLGTLGTRSFFLGTAWMVSSIVIAASFSFTFKGKSLFTASEGSVSSSYSGTMSGTASLKVDDGLCSVSDIDLYSVPCFFSTVVLGEATISSVWSFAGGISFSCFGDGIGELTFLLSDSGRGRGFVELVFRPVVLMLAFF